MSIDVATCYPYHTSSQLTTLFFLKLFARRNTFQFFKVIKQCHREVNMQRTKSLSGTEMAHQCRQNFLPQYIDLASFSCSHAFQDLLVELIYQLSVLPQRVAVLLDTSAIKYFCFLLPLQHMNTTTTEEFEISKFKS